MQSEGWLMLANCREILCTFSSKHRDEMHLDSVEISGSSRTVPNAKKKESSRRIKIPGEISFTDISRKLSRRRDRSHLPRLPVCVRHVSRRCIQASACANTTHVCPQRYSPTSPLHPDCSLCNLRWKSRRWTRPLIADPTRPPKNTVWDFFEAQEIGFLGLPVRKWNSCSRIRFQAWVVA